MRLQRLKAPFAFLDFPSESFMVRGDSMKKLKSMLTTLLEAQRKQRMQQGKKEKSFPGGERRVDRHSEDSLQLIKGEDCLPLRLWKEVDSGKEGYGTSTT